jgi:hypothetical protein
VIVRLAKRLDGIGGKGVWLERRPDGLEYRLRWIGRRLDGLEQTCQVEEDLTGRCGLTGFAETRRASKEGLLAWTEI